MNIKVLPLLLPLLMVVDARAQDSVRDLRGSGKQSAFLTPGQIDRWIFDGDKGETIIAHVVSKEFDPILGLAKTNGAEDKVLFEYDDPGNESRFSFRLPEKGQYKIRVNAFKNQGGGNYTLRVQRFQAQPLVVGTPLIGAFDRQGKGYHYFPGERGQIVIPQVKGASGEAWHLLDAKGRELTGWAGAMPIEEDGECSLIVSGPPNYRYDLVVRAARHEDLQMGKERVGSLQQRGLDVLSFQGQPGEFRVLEVDKKGDVHARLIFASADKKSTQRIAGADDQPEITFLPVASRGSQLRFAAVLGREGKYQLQLLAEAPATYKARTGDPSMPIGWDKDVAGNLPVGGAAFYRFKAAPGQLLQASLSSQSFVPVVRLYDMHGSLVTGGDDGDGLESRITHMAVKEGLYRLQVSSLGDGGGGDFRLALKETKLKELPIGGRGQGTLANGATDYWAFAGKEGQTVFLSVRSPAFDPAISVRSPDGVFLGADNKGGPATGSLLALPLPKTGRYTIGIAARRGAGDYTLRLIDGD